MSTAQMRGSVMGRNADQCRKARGIAIKRAMVRRQEKNTSNGEIRDEKRYQQKEKCEEMDDIAVVLALSIRYACDGVWSAAGSVAVATLGTRGTGAAAPPLY